MSPALTELEHAALNMLLAGGEPVLGVLRQQLVSANVARREVTGVGFFTHFHLSSNAPLIEQSRRFTIADVEAEISGLNHGATFVLFVNKGGLDVLECATYEEPWPTQVAEFKLKYSGNDPRDLSDLHAAGARPAAFG
jgi:hypothetical protein